MKKKLLEKRAELAAKRKTLKGIFDEGGGSKNLDLDKIKSVEGDDQVKLGAIRKLDEEIIDLTKQCEDMNELIEIGKRADLKDVETEEKEDKQEREVKEDKDSALPELGELIVKSDLFKGYQQGRPGKGIIAEGGKSEDGKAFPAWKPEIGLKATFLRTAGWEPQSIRSGVIIPFPINPILVVDVIPGGTTGQAKIVWMEETTRTNNAAERTENTAYAESAYELTERSVIVEAFGHIVPVTDEQLDDVQMVEAYLNNRLTEDLRRRIDGQLLNGNGSTPNIRGILQTTGIQTQAKASDPTIEAFYKAMTKVEVTGKANPTQHIIHPNDWQDIRLAKTNQGVYLFGNPTEAGSGTLWGLPVVRSQEIAEGTGLTFDRTFWQFFTRVGIEVEMGYVGEDFKFGRKSIRARVRGAMVSYRASATCSVTGI